MKLLKNRAAQIATLLFVGLSGWWLYLRLSHVATDSYANQLFGGIYGVMAVVGVIAGFVIAPKWGGRKSLMGRAVLMFTIGLLLQEFGQLAYWYYVFIQHIAVPYPSIGDIGYFGSVLAYIYGTILLAKAAGARFSLKSLNNKVPAFVLPVVMLTLSYIFFLRGYAFDWSNPLKVFLDFGYPFGQAIYISIAILTYLLSRKLLGGQMRPKILFFIFALIIQYLADWTFLYQTSKQTWYAGGINDYTYLVSYFLMTLALLSLNSIFTQQENPS